jgi:hypothetical protein
LLRTPVKESVNKQVQSDATMTVTILILSSPVYMQAVHMLFEGSPDRLWREDEKRISRMVFIGRELDKEAFEEAFNRCRADADDMSWPPGKDKEGGAAAAPAAAATAQ